MAVYVLTFMENSEEIPCSLMVSRLNEICVEGERTFPSH